MSPLFWIGIFFVSLFVLVKGADWFLQSAEKIGKAAGLSSFVIGVVIIGFGTSLPELVASIAAVGQDVPEIVTATAIGSNIANMLLVGGTVALIARRVLISKNLIDLEIPILVSSTGIFLVIVYDGAVTAVESVILVCAYLVYFLYTIKHKDGTEDEGKKGKKEKLKPTHFVFLAGGLIGLVLGAKYLIDAVVALSKIFDIAPGIISITAVSIGTSLPELIVSIKAVFAKKSELAIGNIYGSNTFNALMVVGLPGLLGTMTVGEKTLTIGVPIMALVTLMFVMSGISKRFYLWEGAFFLLMYLVFIGKLFDLF